jgi:hypothetical protein
MSDTPTGLPPEIEATNRQQFMLWYRHHPCGRMFQVFLKNYRDSLIQTHSDRWVRGIDDPKIDEEMRWRAAIIGEFISLDLDKIAMSYGVQLPTDETTPTDAINEDAQ